LYVFVFARSEQDYFMECLKQQSKRDSIIAFPPEVIVAFSASNKYGISTISLCGILRAES